MTSATEHPRAVELRDEEAERSPRRSRYVLLAHAEALHDEAARVRSADHSHREAVIRDLYAIVAFYVANPDHPLPESISLNAHVPAGEVPVVAERWAGGHTYGDKIQCHHDLVGTVTNVTFIVSEPSSDRPL